MTRVTNRAFSKDESHLGRDALETSLFCSKEAQNPLAVLLTGPPGAGKSTVAVDSAHRAGFKVLRFHVNDLAADEAGAVEGSVLDAFRKLFSAEGDRAEEDIRVSRSSPLAIVFDDIDLWAPATLRSPSEFRIVAAICDEVAEMRQGHRSAVAFIATSCDKSMVHPALLNSQCISKVIPLYALSVGSRKEVARRWLCGRFGGEIDGNVSEAVLSEVSDKIAAATPGFLHADMKRLFLMLDSTDWIGSVNLASKESSLMFSSPVFWEVLSLATPSLLATAKRNLISNDEVVTSGVGTLYGLEKQVRQFRECVASVFAARENTDSPVWTTFDALQSVGTFKGLVLHGPTGCGKSSIAGLAAEVVTQNTVNILHIETTSIISSVVGEAERSLSGLFAIARAIAPTIVIMENIDMFAPNRYASEGNHHGGGPAAETFNRILSTLLTEIDGVMDHSGDHKVFCIATTRSLDLVDSALLRPGRFEMHIPVHVPDSKARLEILRSFMRNVPLDSTNELEDIELLNLQEFVKRSEGWTAPDIKSFSRELILQRGREQVEMYHQIHNLDQSLDKVYISTMH